MDIKHNLPGPMEITLSPHDAEMLEYDYFCMDRVGIVGFDGETWVRRDAGATEPSATIVDAEELYVDLPHGLELPITVMRGAITARQARQYPGRDDTAFDPVAVTSFYFGPDGTITVHT